jgi:hypothetical protein
LTLILRHYYAAEITPPYCLAAITFSFLHADTPIITLMPPAIAAAIIFALPSFAAMPVSPLCRQCRCRHAIFASSSLCRRDAARHEATFLQLRRTALFAFRRRQI